MVLEDQNTKAHTLKFAIMASMVTLVSGCGTEDASRDAVSAPVAEQPPQYAASGGAWYAYAAAGAPKTGDAAQWGPKLAKGMEALVSSVKNGLGVMPAGGMCTICSDDDHKALITYMSTPQ